jgi:hypothetical protein
MYLGASFALADNGRLLGFNSDTLFSCSTQFERVPMVLPSSRTA